jgi:hypothetical protein
MTIRERHFYELVCDVRIAQYCHQRRAEHDIEHANAAAEVHGWLSIPEGHACPSCRNRVDEWRERKQQRGAP